MSSEEPGQWVHVVATALTYGAYVVVILGQAGQTPLAEVFVLSALIGTVVKLVAYRRGL
jgi:hypothetical protein